MTILHEIFAHKRDELTLRKAQHPLDALQAAALAAPDPPDFLSALRAAPSHPALIAEVKFASPSRGVLLSGLSPLELAGIYQANGAAALSVLTDQRYFQGRLEYLQHLAAHYPELALLRKDFICDAYQLYEARLAGASAVLLIVAGLQAAQLQGLHALALSLGLTPLVEVHTQAELQAALELPLRLLGINNRDLHSFEVSLQTTLRLRPLVPPGVAVVAESGIHTPADVALLARAGVDAILVGEALVTAEDIGAQVRQLSGASSR